jgi:hypothetical protein
MLNIYQDINEDQFIVSEKHLLANTLFNLNNKLSGARASIISTLNAREIGLAATPIPFTPMSTMLIQHQITHATLPCPHYHGQRHDMHYPTAFNFAVEAAMEEALASRAGNSQRSWRTPLPCRYCIEAGLPLADRFHWHHDCPLPLPPSQTQHLN